MRQLVFVHGIGRPRDADRELQQWTAALADGALRAGHSRMAGDLREGRFRPASFAYYGDLFAPPQAQGTADLDLAHEQAEILAELMRVILDDRLAWADGAREQRAIGKARAQMDAVGQPQGVGNLVRRTIDAATTLLSVVPLRRAGQWATPRLMVGELAQVARYLARGEPDIDGLTLDQRIRARLVQALDGVESAVVVAHSLGTVVALESLHECSVPVPMLVTLGSPIAMRTVVLPRLVPHPPFTPERVSRWLNFWDRDDVIAARPILEADVRSNASHVRVESSRVDSDGVWVHSASKYLSSPAVGGPVAEALDSLSGAAMQ